MLLINTIHSNFEIGLKAFGIGQLTGITQVGAISLTRRLIVNYTLQSMMHFPIATLLIISAVAFGIWNGPNASCVIGYSWGVYASTSHLWRWMDVKYLDIQDEAILSSSVLTLLLLAGMVLTITDKRKSL